MASAMVWLLAEAPYESAHITDSVMFPLGRTIVAVGEFEDADSMFSSEIPGILRERGEKC